VVSLSGLLFGLSAPVGAILGHVALSQIKRTGEQGKGLAVAAVAIGWAITALGLAWIAFMVVAFSGFGYY